MLSVDKLKEVDYIQHLNEVDLVEYCKYYEDEFIPYTFTYTLRDNTTINIEFDKSNLPHLLGFQYLDNKKNLKGRTAWNNMQTGIFTIDSLRKINSSKFRSIVNPRIRNDDFYIKNQTPLAIIEQKIVKL